MVLRLGFMDGIMVIKFRVFHQNVRVLKNIKRSHLNF
jgi:hypothetical protein